MYVAFLRGMNLGGRRLTNDTLRAAFEDMGFEGVSTYRASGNVILRTGDDLELEARIEAGLEARLGYPVPTVVRTGGQVARISAFDGLPRRGSDGGKLQVTLLRSAPSAEAREAALAHATDDDRLAFVDAELFWLPRAGISQSVLDVKALDRLLGLGTTRTMGTIEALAQRLA